MVFKICLFINQCLIRQDYWGYNKAIDYVIGWKLKILFEYKCLPMHGAFSSNINNFVCKIEIQLNNAPLVRRSKR